VTYSQKLAALGRLTSGVAHEVKNPLNAMRIHLELLRTRLGPDRQDVAENVEGIGESLQGLDRVVPGFLRLMRPQEPRLQARSPQVLLEDAARGAEAAAGAANVTIVVEGVAAPAPSAPGSARGWTAAQPPPTVAADRELMGQALANLVSNAIQAMPR